MITDKVEERSGLCISEVDYSVERLFLFGLRGVQNGFDDQYLDQWRDVWAGYTRLFGTEACRPLLDALWEFVRIYRRTAIRPTGYHCLECPCMARDEFLSLALLSSLQHQNADCIEKCLCEIARPWGRPELQSRAWQLAAEFLSLNQRFFPVSISDVEATLSTTDAMRDAQNATFH